jgi:hypothetical protein
MGADTPTVGEQLSARAAHRDILAAWFRAHPLVDILPDELETLVGRNYQQRISDCRTELAMTVENVPRTLMLASGKVKRLSGAYRYRPDGEALGRDAGTRAPATWPGTHPAPFTPPFELTAPESKI